MYISNSNALKKKKLQINAMNKDRPALVEFDMMFVGF
jgi:tyrosine-protein phosphatase YwqE